MDRVLLGHVLRSLTALGIYQTAFQTPFLQQTTEFYATEGLQLMASSDVPDYLKHAEVCAHARSSHPQNVSKPPEASHSLWTGSCRPSQLPGCILKHAVGHCIHACIQGSLQCISLPRHLQRTGHEGRHICATVCLEMLNYAHAPGVLQRRLTEEYERCQNYLDASTRKPLIAAVEEQLLSKHMAAMLEKGFDAMMADMRVHDLARLYNLCGRIHALEPLRAAFRAYIKKAGLALIMDEEKVGMTPSHCM